MNQFVLFTLIFIVSIALPTHCSAEEALPAVDSVATKAEALLVAQKLLADLEKAPDRRGFLRLTSFRSHWKIKPHELRENLTAAGIEVLGQKCSPAHEKEILSLINEVEQTRNTKGKP